MTVSNNLYIFSNIHISVFTDKPYSKPLECNVVYIPVITLNHGTLKGFYGVKIYNLIVNV